MKRKTQKQEIEYLRHMLAAAYLFIDMTMGTQALKSFRQATEREYAIQQTDKVLEIRDIDEFEVERRKMQNLPDANYLP